MSNALEFPRSFAFTNCCECGKTIGVAAETHEGRLTCSECVRERNEKAFQRETDFAILKSMDRRPRRRK